MDDDVRKSAMEFMNSMLQERPNEVEDDENTKGVEIETAPEPDVETAPVQETDTPAELPRLHVALKGDAMTIIIPKYATRFCLSPKMEVTLSEYMSCKYVLRFYTNTNVEMRKLSFDAFEDEAISFFRKVAKLVDEFDSQN